MKITYQYPDGSPVPPNVCIRPSCQRSTIKITLDTMEHPSPSAILAQLSKKWKCQDVTIEEVIVTVQKN